jgi:carboxylesterase type B
MIGYWTRFAANTDPNGAGALAWPVYDPATDPYLNLDDTITSMAGLRAAKCDFWEKLVP